MISGKVNINVLLAFVFGVIFISVMMYLAMLVPNPSDFQLQVFMTALSLSAAGVGAMIPGVAEMRYKGAFQAGGAIVLGLIVWFSQPYIARNIVRFEEPKVSMEPGVEEFLRLLDNHDLAGTFSSLDPAAVAHFGLRPETWKRLLDETVYSLGPLERRRFIGTGAITSQGDSYPIGLYRQNRYLSKFGNAADCRLEAVTARATNDLKWRIFSYEISPMTMPCT